MRATVEWVLVVVLGSHPGLVARVWAALESARQTKQGAAPSLVTVLTDPASHPHASGDYDPWCRPEPRRDFFLSLAFAAQRGGSKLLREAGKRRRDRRAAGRYATGTRA